MLAIPEWNGDVQAARELQRELAKGVIVRDDFPRPLRTVAGLDVGFEKDGAITRAAAVLLDADTLEVIDQQIVRIPTRMPYIPGLLSFRELPALLPALEALARTPDLVMIDGHGIAHPRRLGIAAHFGVITGLPSIGVAKSVLVGAARPLHDTRGAHTPLRDKGEQIGWILRSKPGCLPLIVSPGHRVSMAAAPELVMRFATHYRLPEPTRLADRLASRRDERRHRPEAG
ncbi:deoxyribonuclease V [Solilutibacter silvestris]|uniref:Endonuclease V n=1 Tax=Solilutibacter silvestris TaxID=1645665 RepID=A0A2K1Q402_9GAMM|nr:deoxyribonuclease V [Lysobacter silvestris]PNS09731.1 Deoxyinosine 3'endonuclease (endonuclease V) [Lysobacter silvestris]